MSSSFFRQYISLFSNSLRTLSVSRRLVSALAWLTSWHSAGRLSLCRSNESVRAKKSPQCSQ
ncbi:hypothetical protein BC827DRAFT_1227132, partial [Russula dissimulans]